MAELPTGTVTLLFTDIEGSTQVLLRLGEHYKEVLAQHHQLLRAAFAAHGGHEVDTQGDAFFVVFGRAADAVAAAAEAQRTLAKQLWPEGGALRVRVGLHTGEPARDEDGGYLGIDVHLAARLMAVGHGGQVLLSQTARDLVKNHLPLGVGLRALGEHRLKDLAHPESIWQLVIAGLPADFPPLKSLDNRPHNLPAQLTRLIGRDKEVAAACALLRRDDVRLLTLTGAGGAGKTRLSQQLASELLEDYDDGVFFVALAPLSDPGLAASALAQALGVREVAGRPLPETLTEHLREKRLLLVLDNFEQIVAAAPLVADLLAACPQLNVLVTSRTALRVRGEHEFAVPPLALPGRRPPPPREILSLFASVQLFIERARAARPDFAITDENAPAIAEICHRLDGLPLAIELAAARVKLLPPQAMLARMDEHRLNVASGVGRDVSERQRTLRGAIAWSYDLLEEGEQALFRRLAVFTGGCTLEAAEAVCNGAPVRERTTDGQLGLDVFEGMASLLDNSLLWQHEAENGEPRFSPLETIREFGLEKLAESGEEEAALRQRHADFFLTLAEAAHPQLLGSPEQARWIERLEREQDNLRAALAYLTEAEPAAGLRLATALARFWRTAGHDAELREALGRALERDGGAAPAPVRALALREMGEVLGRTRDREHHARSQALLEESAALSRRTGDLKNLAWTLRKQGEGAHYTAGDLETARAFYEESLAIEHSRGDKRAIGTSLNYLGSLARDTGDLETARALYEEGVAIFREINNTYHLARSLIHLAALAYLQNDIASARACYQESLPVFREMKDRATLLWALGYMGESALATATRRRRAP